MADYTGEQFALTNTLLLQGDSTRPGEKFTSGGGSTPVTATYAQRVFSSGLGVWCYYVGAINATPVSGDTTPNWTGSITAWQVLGRVT